MIRRAELPAAYSLGFNPHLLLSFALPLPLGMESFNDYADLTLTAEVSNGEIVKSLNNHAPGGLVIKAAFPAENKCASVISIADYELNYDFNKEDVAVDVKNLLDSPQIFVMKKTKSGIKEADIRPDILNIVLENNKMTMRLSAGSARFLHPMVVAKLIFGEKLNPACFSRIELYDMELKSLSYSELSNVDFHMS